MKSKKTKTKKKITYGEVDIPDESFEPRNVKERVNCFVDHDVVNWLRKEAESRRIHMHEKGPAIETERYCICGWP